MKYIIICLLIVGFSSGSCNTFDDLNDKIHVPNKTIDVSSRMNNMVTGKSKSKSLIKHISHDCKSTFDNKL